MTAPAAARRASTEEDAELVDALAQSAFETMTVLTRIASDNDLSLTQLRVLGILRDRRLRMGQLVSYLGLDKSTLTGLVARAEKRGLVERAADPDDARAVDVFLSADGAELAGRLATLVGEQLTPMTKTLPAPERRCLRALLGRMVGAYRQPEEMRG